MDQSGVEQDQPSYEQQMYWQEFVQLKADACYIRDYRNSLSRWVTATATIRAIASSGSIAAWVIWRQYAFIWGSIIALSQVTDALKDVFPFYKRRAALSRWVRQLDRMFVFAQRDWEDIAGGRCTQQQIRKLLHQLRSRKQRLEAKSIPDGLVPKELFLQNAEAEAVRYFTSFYGSIEE
jgi:hypothetical protein